MDKKTKMLQTLAIIFAICIVGLVGYIVYDKLTDDKKLEDSNIDSGEIEDDKTSNESSNENVEHLNLNDKLVKNLIEKTKFDMYVKANMYKIGEFTKDTIPNDLILRVGFSKLEFDYWDEKYEENQIIEFSKEEMDNEIKSVFGDIKYTHQTFENILDDLEEGGFDWDAYVIDEINYKDGTYFAYFLFGGGGYYSDIQEHPYKAESINNGERINIYVKTAFAGYSLDDAYEVGVYHSYDFTNNKFVTPLYYLNEGYPEDLLEEYDKYEKYLESYVYTFEKQADGNYYLSGFNKA